MDNFFSDLLPRPTAGRQPTALFLDDFTRCAVNDVAAAPGNRRWLRGLFEGVFAEFGFEAREWGAEEHLPEITFFMQELKLAPSVSSWAALSRYEYLPPTAEAWLEKVIVADIVVGFELPLFLIRYLCRREIPFLDIAIDPVRFARDLFFAIRTNVPPVAEHLARHEVDEDILWTDAALLQGQLRRTGALAVIPEDSTVFFGQTHHDRSLISEGHIAVPLDAENTLSSLTDTALLVRRHPLEETPLPIDALLRQLSHATVTEENSYALLSNPAITQVVSLSSSLLTEARYFHKATTAVIAPDICNPDLLPINCSRLFRTGSGALAPRFWTDRAEATPILPNLLRGSLGASWGRTAAIRLAHHGANGDSRSITLAAGESAGVAGELLQETAAELAAMRASTSWKITAPLRAIKRLYRH